MKYIFKIIFLFLVMIIPIRNIDDDYVYYDYYQYSDVFAVLGIPSIGFRKPIYYYDSDNNDVDRNIMLLKESDAKRNLYLLAGHSGSGDNAYFNLINNIDIGDIIYIDVYHERLVYEVYDIFYVIKNGYISFSLDNDLLYLITCSLVYQNQQLVIVSRLIV